MSNKNKNLFSKLKHNSLRGGMLMELMLSVALAAIAIPFVVRYQKNTIERARNVAVVKQMDIVRRALERCIFEKQSELLRPVNDVVFTEDTDHKKIDCLILSSEDGQYGLINYGLTPEFAADYANDYKLRIRKSRDNNDEAVLQGVVLLTNGSVNSMRTREIVNLGGGKVGFVDGNFIRGGFNAFHTEKSNFNLSSYASGLVETTNATRGDSKYLWRLNAADPEDNNPEDSTMLSFLNLDGHDIVNVGSLGKVQSAYFSNGLTLGGENIDIKNLNFIHGVTLNTNYDASRAIVNGNLNFVSDSSLIVDGVTMLSGNIDGASGYIENLDAVGGGKIIITGDINSSICDTLANFNANLYAENCIIKQSLSLNNIKSSIVSFTNLETPVITTRLQIDGIFASKQNDGYFIAPESANFNDINLTASLKENVNGLNEAMFIVYRAEENKFAADCKNADSAYGLWSKGFCEKCAEGEIPDQGVVQYLKKIQEIENVIAKKYECAKLSNIKDSGSDKIEKCLTEAGLGSN